MKKILFVSTFIFSLAAQAQCNKKIDPNKVILFIDTNNSELEIATSEKAACQRGERLVVVPKNYKEYAKYTTASENARIKGEACIKKKKDCSVEAKQYQDAYSEMMKFTSKQGEISKVTREALEEIKDSGAKLQNVTISGHDGGGMFGGYKGGFSRQQFAKLMKEFPDINEVKSVLLLGCYTGVPKEVIEWKHIFPDIKIIAGYDGSAPLSDKPAGHQYITDILLKEKKLLENAEQKKLQSYAKQNIQGLSQMNAAMYLYCSDGTKEGEFYYGSQKEGKSFRPFDIKECESKKSEIEELVKQVNQYAAGELPVPKDTARGELRTLYNQARRIEHCGEILGVELNVNTVFNLLFYEGVKQNFTNFYKDDLAEAEKIISEITVENLESNFKKNLEEQNKLIEALRNKINLLETNPEAAQIEEKKALDKLAADRDKLFNDPKFAQVKNFINPQTGEYSGPQNLAANLVPLAQELMTSAYGYISAKYNHDAMAANPAAMILMNKQMLMQAEMNVKNQNIAFETIKTNFSKPENKIWVPTAKNLSEKSRKETLSNLHNAYGMLSTPGLSPKQQQALNWMTQATGTHLAYFQNPFSWHEFTGRSEEPQFPIRLKDYTSSQGGYGAGYGGGYNPYGGTSYGGGGMAGGMGGGYGPAVQVPAEMYDDSESEDDTDDSDEE